jgi:hypothetical protein
MKKIVFLLSLAFILFHLSSPAQNWQWGMFGGSNNDQLNGPSREEVSHVTTDNHGNVYALSQVNYSNFINVGGHLVSLPSNTVATTLFSYTCDGTFRWGKVLQVRTVSNLATDTLGGVYIGGMINSNSFFSGSFTDYDADTLWDIYSYDMKFLVLLKLDTSGNLQWIRQPQPDTITYASPQSVSIDMNVEKDGTIHWMNALFPANYADTGLVVTNPGCYMLKYDRNGNFTGSTPIGLDYAPSGAYLATGYYNTRFAYSKNNNRYIVTGSSWPGDPALTIGGNAITQMLYVASFDAATGNNNWVHQSSGMNSLITLKPAIDAQNNIFIAGMLGHGFSFNGFTQSNAYTTTPHLTPFIQKMDANGNAIWSRGTSATIQTNPGGIVLSDSVVAVTSSYGGPFKWNSGNETFNSTPSNTGVNILLTRFNRFNGNYMHTDTIASWTDNFEYPAALAADAHANFYVGGKFEASLMVNGNPMYSSGGINDFFLAKFGNATCGPQSPVGLKTMPDEQSVMVYPNPATSFVTVDHLPLNAELTLSDALGRKLQTVLCLDEKQTLFTAHLRPGIYFIEVKHGNARTTRKIVIE